MGGYSRLKSRGRISLPMGHRMWIPRLPVAMSGDCWIKVKLTYHRNGAGINKQHHHQPPSSTTVCQVLVGAKIGTVARVQQGDSPMYPPCTVLLTNAPTTLPVWPTHMIRQVPV